MCIDLDRKWRAFLQYDCQFYEYICTTYSFPKGAKNIYRSKFDLDINFNLSAKSYQSIQPQRAKSCTNFFTLTNKRVEFPTRFKRNTSKHNTKDSIKYFYVFPLHRAHIPHIQFILCIQEFLYYTHTRKYITCKFQAYASRRIQCILSLRCTALYSTRLLHYLITQRPWPLIWTECIHTRSAIKCDLHVHIIYNILYACVRIVFYDIRRSGFVPSRANRGVYKRWVTRKWPSSKHWHSWSRWFVKIFDVLVNLPAVGQYPSDMFGNARSPENVTCGMRPRAQPFLNRTHSTSSDTKTDG